LDILWILDRVRAGSTTLPAPVGRHSCAIRPWSKVKSEERRVRIAWSLYQSPIGPLTLVVRGERLLTLAFDADPARTAAALARRLDADAAAGMAPRALRNRLDRYFGGEVDALDRIVAEPGGTPFQDRVWTALRAIPAGTTTSYGELARRIGRPGAVRAVGAANGANPVAVVVPCHRVIGANGSLVGYGGGLDRKRWLLAHEGVMPGRLW
jgi:methylated-DNA-[protein]-cysteine S-methyltransferase